MYWYRRRNAACPYFEVWYHRKTATERWPFSHVYLLWLCCIIGTAEGATPYARTPRCGITENRPGAQGAPGRLCVFSLGSCVFCVRLQLTEAYMSSLAFSASWRTPEKLRWAASAASLSQAGRERVFFTARLFLRAYSAGLKGIMTTNSPSARV